MERISAMKLHFLIGTFFLMGVLLLWAGVPLPSVAAGICSGAYLTWRKNRRHLRNFRTRSNSED